MNRNSHHSRVPPEEIIDARRASALTGLPVHELLLLSRLNGCGRLIAAANGTRKQEMVFTYEDLRRLALIAAPSQE